MVFYLHYEKEPDKAKIVVVHKGETTSYLVDKVVCHVAITSEKSDTHPKFRLCGICKTVELLNNTLYIY
jgi:hypothetical protein